jgi:hypothetical protein
MGTGNGSSSFFLSVILPHQHSDRVTLVLLFVVKCKLSCFLKVSRDGNVSYPHFESSHYIRIIRKICVRFFASRTLFSITASSLQLVFVHCPITVQHSEEHSILQNVSLRKFCIHLFSSSWQHYLPIIAC